MKQNNMLGWMMMVVMMVVVMMKGVEGTPAFPLRTEGRYIVDSNGDRVRLAGVNWYGADQADFVVGGLHVATLSDISQQIVSFGFNFVRIPFSNQLVEQNPIVANKSLVANPSFFGMRALDILDLVIERLTDDGIMIMLDNHVSDAIWCCNTNDGNGLWYTSNYTKQQWIDDWMFLVKRYSHIKHFIAVDLRNEIRQATIDGKQYTPVWGGGSEQDWHSVATEIGNTILSINPDLLIVVEAIEYALDFTGIFKQPVVLNISNKVVYEAHNYRWDQGYNSCEDYWGSLKWLSLLSDNTAPVILGEFGTCNIADSCVYSTVPSSQGLYFNCLIEAIQEYSIDWAYWTLDGTQSSSRSFGAPEGYGVFNPYWNSSASNLLTRVLQSVATF
eukprot:TRINITY_DN4677_c0_g1_i1.p1 TRINITY_DN4677_c0_g1~~TRINITY_DN4677_c0_g1_i1.p1  ORF type:complete len:387 (+),score=70.43 TRINITY_DN4677_c0_g1_i1:487-1647(+)